jgi:hypothetical protein
VIVDFDLEAWWHKNGIVPDDNTDEAQLFVLCEGLTGDILNRCERNFEQEKQLAYQMGYDAANRAAKEECPAEEDDGSYEVLPGVCVGRLLK